MKKNFLTVAAMAVVAFFVSTEIAKAADISFSGQIRSRWEVNEHSNGAGVGGQGAGTSAFSDATAPDDFVFSSVRLAATANVNDSTSAFIQLQSVRTWGNGGNGVAGGLANQGQGSGNASYSPNNTDASVGVHQAYFTLKNFANLPVAMDLKLGRQEIKLDGWRLYGNTIWTPGMQTHDAARLDHVHDNMSLSYMYIITRELGRTDDPGDQEDGENHVVYFQYKGVLGGTFSAIYSFLDDGCGGGASSSCAINGTDTIHTVGGRQAGQLFGIDYRLEAYYQGGQADNQSLRVNGSRAAGTPYAAGQAGQVSRGAHMLGVRVGKTFNNVMFKPGLTLWYDYLSGTSDADAANGEYNSFNTLFDTGHKFYGLQDVFLAIGSGNSQGTNGLGLQDIAVKTKFSPMPGWTLKADGHVFLTAENPNSNPRMTQGLTTIQANNSVGTGFLDNYLGTEYDITLVNKYNANTNIILGWSNFQGSNTFRNIRNDPAGSVGSDDANWGYVQFDVKF